LMSITERLTVDSDTPKRKTTDEVSLPPELSIGRVGADQAKTLEVKWKIYTHLFTYRDINCYRSKEANFILCK
jgi:hypothetical protein